MPAVGKLLRRVVVPIIVGVATGVALAAAIGYLWLIFGADPNKDPLLSW